MDLNQDSPTRELVELAYALGQEVAHAGDFGLLMANVAIGYRDARLADAEPDSPSPAYTGSRQIGRSDVVAVEPNSAADQERRRRESKAHYQAILAASYAMFRAAEELIEEAALEAKRERLTWTEIGEPLEISMQGASQRFGPKFRAYKEISSDITES